ncbi:adenine deaminase C-terminal domain-containing protein [Paenibacillus lentus]|uniref:adenine deaminase n=1 Tax=Paenibacillus lentus TaxID=1338368 RepID=A0A3Q8S5E5_9BACL|nr:adenine deaminase C-terminal domain-containing protein [Paenibacillus lentus]AZK47449.1 adenine deaminase [Paenibacillus lentus]
MRIVSSSFQEYQELISVSLGSKPATMWIKNAQYLNVYTGQVERGNIYISTNRIAYVGDKEFVASPETSIVELEQEQILVPGYIEPHAHPCQMYNPFTWGDTQLRGGTVLSINDNLSLLMQLGEHRAIQFIEELNGISRHMFLWWCNFDQLQLNNRDSLQEWLLHPLVVQGGEFTEWFKLLQGDEELQERLYMLKGKHRMRVEGHLPGVSYEKISGIAAAGIGADHEALNAKDVLKRLRLGLYATLRYSSIRPDLPDILQGLVGDPRFNLNRVMLTSDGPSPNFTAAHSCASMIKLCIEAGIPAADAYRLGTLNPATYYGLDEDLGGIAPGKLACFNVLSSLSDPTPIHVMQQGKWHVWNRCQVNPTDEAMISDWLKAYFPSSRITVNLTPAQIRVETDIGIELINDVITKPYEFTANSELDAEECFISLLDSHGQWGLHTRLKGFATGVVALASTYSASKDTLLIGRNLGVMCDVLRELNDRGDGILAYFANGEQVYIPLPLGGTMSAADMRAVSDCLERFTGLMREHGYRFRDPAYTLLFLTASHLPNIRMSERGLYLVKNDEVIISPVQLNID